jgi:uncharacterized protein DUF6900
MKPIEEILSRIASHHLGIHTLETRRSDRHDFHDVAVWNVKAALTAAFEAGAAATGEYPATLPAQDLPRRFDDYEIQPCRRYMDLDEPHISFVEPCEASEADFWTLFGHIPGEGAQAIGDFDTRQHAEEVFARITGHPYAETTQDRERHQP